MAENKPHLKQMPQGFSLHWQESDTTQTLLTGEAYLLELISGGAPLSTVLNNLCSALDAQIGNVASLVLLPDDDECYLHTVAQTAAHFGFSIFRSTGLFSRSWDLLGTFEMFCCFPRTPTSRQIKLIERAECLATFAIQSLNHEEDSGSISPYGKGAMERSSLKMYSSKN